ncbi:MAG: glycine zipper family protein [Geobacter sp.]|nr:glycine zipper family protein [Geobacter sp.]
MRKTINRIAALILPIFILSSCATYKTQYAGFRPADAYPNSQVVSGITIGGEAYADGNVAAQAFGFDIRGAGLLPVQVVMDNKSGSNLVIDPTQTFLIDNEGRYWNIIPNNVAVERVDKFTTAGEVVKGGAKGALIGATAGAILGAAIGIVSGRSIGEGAWRAAGLGAGAGAVIGGVSAGTDREREHRIADDIKAKGLEGKDIPDDYIANGFIFFPGEATSAKGLRLQFLERETGKVRTVILDF